MKAEQPVLEMDAGALATRVKAAFEENFLLRGEVGASVCVMYRGETVVSLADGTEGAGSDIPWTNSSRVLWWSATKPLSASAVLLALHDAGIAFEAPVATVWPEFAAGGKEEVTFLDVLSHRAGLPGIPGALLDPYDHKAVASALAAMSPLWPTGSGHGYHARTFGYLADEIVRRASGTALRDFWRERIAVPAGSGFRIGVGEEQADEVADSLPPSAMRIPAGEEEFFAALGDSDSLTSLAFRSPSGDIRPKTMNAPRARAFGFPALGGIGTPQDMASVYAMVLNVGRVGGRHVLPEAVCRALATPLVSGYDRVLCMPTAFSAGAMLDPLGPVPQGKLRYALGPSRHAFGHPGAGGCLAFADPERSLVFAYCMNKMDVGVMPSARAKALVQALYGGQ